MQMVEGGPPKPSGGGGWLFDIVNKRMAAAMRGPPDRGTIAADP
jgi:hypothetical protein